MCAVKCTKCYRMYIRMYSFVVTIICTSKNLYIALINCSDQLMYHSAMY